MNGEETVGQSRGGLEWNEAMRRWTDFDPSGSAALSVDAERQKELVRYAGRYHFNLEKWLGCKHGMHRKWRRGARCLNESQRLE